MPGQAVVWSGLSLKGVLPTVRDQGNRTERRVAHALLRLVRQAGRRVEGGVEVDFPLSRQDIAAMTGTTLHTVSRILSGWETRGIVESGRQPVTIRQPHALVAIAEDLPRPGAPG